MALELECLAIIFAYGKFDQCIYGRGHHKEVNSSGSSTTSCSACSFSHNDMIWILCTCLENSKFSKDEIFNLTFKEALNSKLNEIEEDEFFPKSDQRWIGAAKVDEELKLLQKSITYGWPDQVNQVAEVIHEIL